MKDNFKMALKLYGKIVLATVMCFFIVISINVIATGFFTKNIGYVAYGTTSTDSEPVELYTHMEADGEDKLKEKYEEDGYTITTSNIRSEVSKSGRVFFLVVSQIFCLLLLLTFIYSPLWEIGIKDNNLVKFGHKSEDKLRGLRCGLLASIPYGIFVIAIFVLRYCTSVKFPTVFIKFVNAPFYTLTELVIGKSMTLDEVSFIKLLGLLIIGGLVPLISYISYLIGYKDISLSEKLLYKKKKNN